MINANIIKEEINKCTSCHYINIISKIIGTISVILIFFTFISFIINEKYNKNSYIQIMCLLLAILITTISYLINLKDESNHSEEEGKETICQIQGFLMTTFELSQFIWGSIISLTTYYALLGREDISFEPTCYTIFIYFLCAFFLPLILGLILTFFKKYDYIGHWCWVDKESPFYIFCEILLWICGILNLICTVKAKSTIKKISRNIDGKQEIKDAVMKILIFPITQISTMAIIGLLIIIDFIFFHKNNDIIKSLRSLIYCFNGILMSLAYGIGSIITQRFTKMINKIKRKDKQKPLISEQLLNDTITESDVLSGY